MAVFRKPSKQLTHAKVLLSGVSGAGKTTTALYIAQGLAAEEEGARVAMIDTQHGQGDLEAGRFDFDIAPLEDCEPQRACANTTQLLRHAYKEGYGIVVLDSISTVWSQVLEWRDMMEAKQSFSGWGHPLGTEWNKLLKACLAYPGHIIVTAREKMKFEKRGRDIVPVGYGRIIRPETEYEFPLTLRMDRDHRLVCGEPPKDVYSRFAEMSWTCPGAELGTEIARCIRGEPTDAIPQKENDDDQPNEERDSDGPEHGDDELPWEG